MNSSMYLILAIAIIAFVTLLTRAIPFLIFGGKELPSIITYLAKVLPPCIMVVLVCFCLKGVKFATLNGWLPELIACVVVTIVHSIKKNLYLSIIVGTICYMIIIRLM